MTTSTLFFIFMSFLSVSIKCIQPPTTKNEKGISSYCQKSQLYPSWYPPTPIECCDHRGQCDDYIEPNQTKYGLTNTDPEWRRRLCGCDQRLYECVRKVAVLIEKEWPLERAFSHETCFHRVVLRFNGTSYKPEYEFMNVLSYVKTSKRRH